MTLRLRVVPPQGILAQLGRLPSPGLRQAYAIFHVGFEDTLTEQDSKKQHATLHSEFRRNFTVASAVNHHPHTHPFTLRPFCRRTSQAAIHPTPAPPSWPAFQRCP